MHELDRQLEKLVSQAQLYLITDQKRRKKVIQDLWDTMLPSSNLRGRQQKPTDEEARRRLAGLKRWSRDKYGKTLEGDFNEDWSDVLSDAQIEVLKKIDIYRKGVDFQLFKEWQKFCEKLQQQQTPEVCSELEKQVEKFRIRFLQRRTKNGTKNYPPEKSQRLTQACQTFLEKIKSGEIDLQETWNIFCDEVQQLYRPLKFWNWFASRVKFRFIDMIRKKLKEVSGDAPGGNPEENTTTQTRLEKAQKEADKKLSPEVIKIIYEDKDGIFRGKHIRNFPNVNFREIAVLKSQETTLTEIQTHFDNKVDAQTTISPFYTRTCRYFQPIIKEYCEAKLALPETVLQAIINDENGKFKSKKMGNNEQINFHQIICRRVNDIPSWTILARELQIDVKNLIYFYLDSIRSFKLIPQAKTRTRKQKNSIPQEI